MQYQSLLQQLATDRYASAEHAYSALVRLADGYWHKNAMLTLDGFEGVALQKAAYSLELLVGFANSLDDERYRYAQCELELAKAKLSDPVPQTFYSFEKPARHCFDEVAIKWGLTRGASPRKVAGFLDLQRRSYTPAELVA